jgi:hypothetical protein
MAEGYLALFTGLALTLGGLWLFTKNLWRLFRYGEYGVVEVVLAVVMLAAGLTILVGGAR